MKRGFTLIEMIITIVLLGILSGLGVTILKNVFIGYGDTKTKNLLYNEAKYIYERIGRELRIAIPNTIRTGSDYIQYIMFEKSFYYEDNNSSLITIYGNNDNLSNRQLSIYNVSPDNIYNGDRLYTIEDNSSLTSLYLDKNIDANSPYNRCFVIDTPVTIFKENNYLKRCFNYTINSSDGKNSGTCNILANYIDNVDFKYLPGNNQNNAVVEISLTLKKNNVTMNYKNKIHIRNVP